MTSDETLEGYFRFFSLSKPTVLMLLSKEK